MNTQVKLAKRVIGLPDESAWDIQKSPIPSPSDGEVLIKNIYVSLDPAMRGWINDEKSYLPPVGIGEVMRALTVGKVIESKNEDIEVGTYLTGTGNVQQYIVSDGKGWQIVQKGLVPLPIYLSVLGMTGLTAYFGLLDIGKPKAGETVLISGAAGAVGSIVGQIAKAQGCRAVGIAGGEEKCRHIVEDLGFDAAIDYKKDDMKAALKTHCPDGIDIYFDNVGGEILDLALTRINQKARVVLCGAISQYNNKEQIIGPSNYLSLLINRARMEGFIILDYVKQYGQAVMQMAQWMGAGKLKSNEYVIEGIENFPQTFQRLFSGDKMGKLILKVNEDA